MRRLIGRGLERTAPLWPGIERIYGWVHRATSILGNEAGETAAAVRRRFDGRVAFELEMTIMDGQALTV